MNWPWLIWLAAVVASFAVLERYALRHGDRMHTLSRVVWLMGQRFPLTLVLWGVIIGGLSVHFYWRWCDQPQALTFLISR